MASPLPFGLGASPQEWTLSERPSRLLLVLEARAAMELASLPLALPLLFGHIPRGDGHPVLVLPGLLAGDRSTAPLRAFLNQMGYEAQGWGLGRNLGPRKGLLAAMQSNLMALHERDQRKVTVIGWSLGGVYARELARTAPQHVRQIITLGSPLHGDADRTTNASRVYHRVAGKIQIEDPLRNVGPPPVPTTSIYSRSDGVVAWQSSVERAGARVQNVEVLNASHTGLGVNPLVWLTIGNRLSQPEGTWRRFEPPVWAKWVFPETASRAEVPS